MDTEKPSYALKVKNLSFAYGSNKVLNDISLEIEEGCITTIMGANGCGKSTLFLCMTRNLKPKKGSIFLRKKNILNIPMTEYARQISIVHQNNTAAADLTVERLVAYGRTPYSKLFGGGSSEDERLIDWALEVTNLTDLREREVSRLSGGQRQRAFIAMALAQNTKILFLDEPTTYLDIRYQLEILELIRRLNREFGITIIMVLHDINQAVCFSDRIIGLKDGKVAVQGKPEDVITSENLYTLYGVQLRMAEADGRKYVLTGSRDEEESFSV